MDSDALQHEKDLQHLNLLKIFYYISAGLSALGSVGIGGIYLVLGIVMAANIDDDEAALVGTIFVGVAAFLILLGIVWGFVTYLAARRLGERRGKTFILVVAAIHCLSVPIGTCLGVFTFIVLLRPSVEELFQANEGA